MPYESGAVLDLNTIDTNAQAEREGLQRFESGRTCMPLQRLRRASPINPEWVTYQLPSGSLISPSETENANSTVSALSWSI